MERITYSAAEKKKLKAWEWNSRNTDFGHRVVKMLRPICKDCQSDPNHRTNWFDQCPHFPKPELKYWARQAKVIKIPNIVEDEAGDMIVESEEVKTKLVLVPNWVEVALDTAHNDGQGFTKAQRKGFVLPETIGLAPMCQYSGCGNAWPSLRTTEGDYCNEYQAKVATANQNEINLQAVGWGDPKLRRQQIQDISV